jgi:RimJ/RimL family protein N-acetyltransferase
VALVVASYAILFAARRCLAGATLHRMQLPSVVPTFRDETVILDGHVPEDLGPRLGGEDEETARRFGWWPERSTEETVRAAFQRWAAEWRSGGPTRALAARDCLVGGCELRIQPDGTGHVSYWTNAQYRKKGYATHALGLLCRYAASIGIARLEAHVATDNYASRRVAEGAGFEAQGLFTDEHGQVMMRYGCALPGAEVASVSARNALAMQAPLPRPGMLEG